MQHNGILIINAGSTSLKFALYTYTKKLNLICRGAFTQIPDNTNLIIHDQNNNTIFNAQLQDVNNYKLAFSQLITILNKNFATIDIKYAGHRIVSGGDKYAQGVILNTSILDYLASLNKIEPTHQNYEVAVAKDLMDLMPNIIQTASFDTAFHQTLPQVAKFYPVPKEITKHCVQHWGFHGLSYHYIANTFIKLNPKAKKIIVAHLGGGASICAIKNAKSIETSMQFGALTGLPMATRSGDFPVDAAFYLLQEKIFTLPELSHLLSTQSGLASSGVSANMQILRQKHNNFAAQTAIKQFEYALLKYIGSYITILGGVDALIFTAGIGENDALLRENIVKKLNFLMIKLNKHKNQLAVGMKNAIKISSNNSKTEVWVIPTNEEIMIAQELVTVLKL
ncbi:MAG: hypothetical protein RL017_883 [Pseudomonadota bacterium]|jgi:acetate kinase|nr:acetate/propionate family kinase [Burkholderiales bacterium]